MDKCCLTIDICWFLFFTDNFLSIFYGGIMQDYIFSNDFSRNLDAMIYTCDMKPVSLVTVMDLLSEVVI